ncbi:MAG TPA: VacJ family lipoprotein [Proteobacteria bacterium]|nr:VacJ family lipoprotein [Pseudomonadota bacterium]
MSRQILVIFLAVALLFWNMTPGFSQPPGLETDEFAEYDGEAVSVKDPLEVLNRVFFVFNDRLQLWVLEPVARGYKIVTPSLFRTGLLNFFSNLLEPTRVINCLLQGRFKAAEESFLRFMLNSTVGVGGLMDPASYDGLKSHEYQFASTLATYGMGSGPYLVLPFWGPHDFRGILGLGGDTLASPLFYALYQNPVSAVAVQGSNAINRTSFRLGEYEKMLSGALDPYLAVRDAFQQHRREILP